MEAFQDKLIGANDLWGRWLARKLLSYAFYYQLERRGLSFPHRRTRRKLIDHIEFLARICTGNRIERHQLSSHSIVHSAWQHGQLAGFSYEAALWSIIDGDPQFDCGCQMVHLASP